MQLPWLDPQSVRSSIPEGLNGITDTIMRARQMEAQRQQQMADMLLRKKQTEAEERRAVAEEGRQKLLQEREDRANEKQRKADYSQALLTIKKHLAPGPDYNPDYARAVAEANGITGFGQEEQGPEDAAPPPPMGQPATPAMSAPQEPQGPPPAPEGGPPLPPFRVGPRGPIPMGPPPEAAMQPPAPMPQAGLSPVEPPPLTPGGGPPLSERDQQKMETAGLAQQLATSPQRIQETQAAHDDLQARRSMGRQTAGYPVFKATGPNGEALRFETGSGQQSLQQQREEVMARGMAAADAIEQQNPALKPMADKTRALAQYVKAGLMKPEDFATHIEKLIGMENQVSIAQGHDATRIATAKKRGGGTGMGGGSLKEATPVIKQMTDSLKDIKTKGGLADMLTHSEGAMNQLRDHGENPTAWTNAIDAMIRTNTGRAAIKAQYDLYLSKSAGKLDSIDQMAEKLKTSRPSAEQRKNLLDAMQASNAELRREAHDRWENFRHYDEDPAVARNRYVREAYNRLERDTFGTMPGYQKPGADGSHPLVSAARQGKLSPGDQAIAVKARATKPTDPAYADAQRWLQAHGLK